MLVEGVHASTTRPSPAVAVKVAGLPGGWVAACGVALCEADAVPLPAAFLARTRKAYCVPLVSPALVYERVEPVLLGTAVQSVELQVAVLPVC